MREVSSMGQELCSFHPTRIPWCLSSVEAESSQHTYRYISRLQESMLRVNTLEEKTKYNIQSLENN